MTSSFAFAPAPVRTSTSQHHPLTVLHSSAFTYEDWHTSLHPLDDLGVSENFPAGSWDNANVNAHIALPSAVHSADGELITEIAVAFLPVALLIMLEIIFA